jgi:uncharacterized protein YciI
MNRRSSISLIRRSLFLTIVALTLALAPRSQCAEAPTPGPAPAASKPSPKKQFLIILRLAPRLYDDKAWTDADKATVTAHFQRLKAATTAGQVLLAGRTPEPGDKTMGLVVFTADDEAAARAFMAGDPCVAAGVMLGELRPFGVALVGKN